MNRYVVPIKSVVQETAGVQLVLRVPEQMVRLIRQQSVRQVEVGVDDGRLISVQQRKKIYATLRDLAEYTGYTDEAMKEVMKLEHMLRTGGEYFSLADCSITEAREFINTLMEYALKEGVIMTESGLQRTDDIDTYLIQCIRYRKCCICGRAAELHHVDAIGMGNDRRHYDDRLNRVMALCRTHHTIYHQRGGHDFMDTYKVYGIERHRVEKFMQQEMRQNEPGIV